MPWFLGCENFSSRRGTKVLRDFNTLLGGGFKYLKPFGSKVKISRIYLATFFSLIIFFQITYSSIPSQHETVETSPTLRQSSVAIQHPPWFKFNIHTACDMLEFYRIQQIICFWNTSDDMNHCQGYITESKMKDLHPAMPVTGQSWDLDGYLWPHPKMCCNSGYMAFAKCGLYFFQVWSQIFLRQWLAGDLCSVTSWCLSGRELYKELGVSKVPSVIRSFIFGCFQK